MGETRLCQGASRVCLCSMCLFLNIFNVYSVGNRSSRDCISILVLLSVLLFLSLLANGVLSYLCEYPQISYTHKHTSLWYILLHYMQYFHSIFLTVYSSGTNQLIGCGTETNYSNPGGWNPHCLNVLAIFCFLTSVQINKQWKTRGVMLIDHMCPWQFLELIHFCY